MANITQGGGAVTKSPETILREALVVARDELKRCNDQCACVRHDPFGVVLDALHRVPPIPTIPHASEVECRIVGRVIEALFDAGYVLTINDGEEDVLVGMTREVDRALIWNALGSTDADTIKVSKDYRRLAEGEQELGKRSFVYLVWGNDTDVISDYGVSLEAILAPINDYAEGLR